jgi:hypothetical protein
MPTKRAGKEKRKRPLRPGQPNVYSSLNDEIEERLCEYLGKGVPIKVACDAIRLPRSTFYHWEELALQSDDPKNRYAAFMVRVRQAQAIGWIHLHEEIMKVDPKWVLGRCARDHYPPETQRTELSGPDGQPIRTQSEVTMNIYCSGPLPEIPVEEWRGNGRN